MTRSGTGYSAVRYSVPLTCGTHGIGATRPWAGPCSTAEEAFAELSYWLVDKHSFRDYKQNHHVAISIAPKDGNESDSIFYHILT